MKNGRKGDVEWVKIMRCTLHGEKGLKESKTIRLGETMTEKSCFTCKYFEVRNNFHTDTGQDTFKTSLKKCGWE